MSSEVLELLVNSRRYGGWKSLSIVRSVQAMSGKFSLSVTDKWSVADAWPIREGDECQVMIDNSPIITGKVDGRFPGIGAGEHSLTISGRDSTLDPIDCSVELGAWELKTKSLELIKKIAAKYGIPVNVQAGVALRDFPDGKISLSPGETGFEVIDRVVRYSGFLPMADGKGGILIGTPGQSLCPVRLEEGRNITGGQSRFERGERFERYVVLAQRPGTENTNGEAAFQVRGEYVDRDMAGTGRVKIIQAEEPCDQSQANARAKWEGVVRAARAEGAEVTVQGWKPTASYVWTQGDRVSVTAPRLGISGTMMFDTVELTVDKDQGRVAKLTLARPDAFSLEPLPASEWKKTVTREDTNDLDFLNWSP